MAISAYPFDDQDTTETQYSQLFRELQDSGVADSAGGPGFAVSANASGMRVAVQPGFALLRGHAILSTAVETLPVGAAGTQSRVDRVVCRLDPVQNGIVLAVVEGIPGNGVPPLTQTDTGVFELPLARVTVAPGAVTIAADDVADDRRFVGTRIGAWTTTTRPSGPRVAQLGLNTTAGRWEYFDGSTWTDLAPVITWTTIAGKPAVFAPATHRHDWNDLDNAPAAFTPVSHTHPWGQVTGVPATFPPSSHTHPWGELTAVPSTFAPTSHTHTIANVSGLQSSLDGKSATSHTHATPTTVYRANGSDRVHDNSPAGSGWYAVWCDGNHNFCHNTSSIRYKERVRDHRIDPAAVLALRPVLYDRKPTLDEITGEWQPGPVDEFGLIAEEVVPHLPEIVQWAVDDDTGVWRPESLRYDLLPVAILSVLRDQEHRIVKLESRLRELGGEA